MRLNVTMSEELWNQVTEQANAKYISRSAYISMAVAEKLKLDGSKVNKLKPARRMGGVSGGAGERGTAPACPLAGDR